MNDFVIKQNDTSPNIKSQLKDSDSNPVDLSQVNSIFFHMEDYDAGEVIIEKEATIEDAKNGIVYYDWQEGDTANPGKYLAEWQVNFDDVNVETFPNDSYIVIEIVRELA